MNDTANKDKTPKENTLEINIFINNRQYQRLAYHDGELTLDVLQSKFDTMLGPICTDIKKDFKK